MRTVATAVARFRHLRSSKATPQNDMGTATV